MTAVIWTETARAQYRKAITYLSQSSPDAAERLALRIRETTDGLARRPTGRPGYVEGSFEKIIPKTSYLMVFDLVGDEIQILRLFHMAQDWRAWDKRTDDAAD